MSTYDEVYPLSRPVVQHGPITGEQHFTCVATFGEDDAHTSPYFWLSLPASELGCIDGYERWSQ